MSNVPAPSAKPLPLRPGQLDGTFECEVNELEGDAGWHQWQELMARQDAGFAPTDHSALPMPPAPQPAPGASAPRPAGEGLTVDDVLMLARKNGRVCPQPAYWRRIVARLPDRPPRLATPLEGRSWRDTGALVKRAALREQIEWAATTGNLGLFRDLLAQLPEEAWHHIGE